MGKCIGCGGSGNRKIAKIMVFDERIKSYNERIFTVKPCNGECGMCGEYHEGMEFKVQSVHAVMFGVYPICLSCARIYYGGQEVDGFGGKRTLAEDPLLEIINWHDPIPCINEQDEAKEG